MCFLSVYRQRLVGSLLLLALVAFQALGDTPDKASKAEQVVDKQIAAYNARDIDAFVATYARDIEIHQFGKGMLYRGIRHLREKYGSIFARLKCLEAISLKRIVQGDFVVDHELARGCQEQAGRIDYEVRLIVVYEVKDNLIQKVVFFRDE
jgi:hypothetical protein